MAVESSWPQRRIATKTVAPMLPNSVAILICLLFILEKVWRTGGRLSTQNESNKVEFHTPVIWESRLALFSSAPFSVSHSVIYRYHFPPNSHLSQRSCCAAASRIVSLHSPHFFLGTAILMQRSLTIAWSGLLTAIQPQTRTRIRNHSVKRDCRAVATLRAFL